MLSKIFLLEVKLIQRLSILFLFQLMTISSTWTITLPGTIKELSKQTVQNIQTAVKELSGLGAKKFMVVNSTDLSVVPWEVTNSQPVKAKEYTNRCKFYIARRS